jgi:hypothetical protein
VSVAQLRRIAGRLSIYQPTWAVGVEPQNPVTNDLKTDAADPRRIRSAPAVMDHRQRQQPTRLRRVLDRLGQRP